MAELSKNQISGGTPVRSEDEKKETSNQYSVPAKQETTLPSGDKVNKYKEPMNKTNGSKIETNNTKHKTPKPIGIQILSFPR